MTCDDTGKQLCYKYGNQGKYKFTDKKRQYTDEYSVKHNFSHVRSLFFGFYIYIVFRISFITVCSVFHVLHTEDAGFYNRNIPPYNWYFLQFLHPVLLRTFHFKVFNFIVVSADCSDHVMARLEHYTFYYCLAAQLSFLHFLATFFLLEFTDAV